MFLNINELLLSLSQALDFAEREIFPNNVNHGMRVAYISARLAEKLEMPETEQFDLISYALLHDNGVMASVQKTHRSLAVSVEDFSVENDPGHCVEGEKNLDTFPFIERQKNVVLYHHENYDGSGFFQVHGSDIPLYARIIHLADYTAVRCAKGWEPDQIVGALKEDRRFFDPTLYDVMLELAAHVEFWLGQDSSFVHRALFGMIPQVTRELDYSQIRQISQMFSHIIDEKSPFTGSHSRGISERVGFICQYYEFDDTTYWQMRIAADLHDLGKLIVPNSILDKPAKLNRSEFRVVQAHPFYTRRILERINGFENITQWASNHHEKLNGSGYPYGLNAGGLDFNSRILACVDIYQALTEDRPYRQGMTHDQAMTIMHKMVHDGLIEPSVTEDMDSIFRDGDI